MIKTFGSVVVTNLPIAAIRRGGYGDGTLAGVFTWALTEAPSNPGANTIIGFRGARTCGYSGG